MLSLGGAVADLDHDYIVIGSGFGGSVSGLRLVEKGYDVLMVEKGSEHRPEDFPRTNWNLKRWMWIPRLGFRGFFKITFLRHLTVLSGVGVGGGSIGYACTHPVPKDSFFTSGSWAGLSNWKTELEPHYETAKRMLGVAPTPMLTPPDELLREIAEEEGRAEDFHPTNVAVYFGEPGETVGDPYFGGEGPDRTGCIRCGGCMLGCQHGAKNSLDKNYLYLARRRGMQLHPDTEVTHVQPLEAGGYRVVARHGRGWKRERVTYTARNVVFAGGVLGTVKLLLKLRDDPEGLPRLPKPLGSGVRTNSEQLTFVVTPKREHDLSRGVAIGSILHTGEHSHLEPVRYSAGSGFFRLLLAPYVPGDNSFVRVLRMFLTVLRHPVLTLRTYLVPDLAKYSLVLLYMRTSEGMLHLVRKRGRLTTRPDRGTPAVAYMPEARPYIEKVAKKLGGMALSGLPETLFNIPVTAHILGGCCIGDSSETGVIDTQHRVFNYEGLYVVDGSAMSANPGVNPALSITALAERAMSFIPERSAPRAQPPVD